RGGRDGRDDGVREGARHQAALPAAHGSAEIGPIIAPFRRGRTGVGPRSDPSAVFTQLGRHFLANGCQNRRQILRTRVDLPTVARSTSIFARSQVRPRSDPGPTLGYGLPKAYRAATVRT